MKLPYLNVLESGERVIEEFLGYNHNPRILENEFYDMENLSADEYPVLSVRKKRGVITRDEGIKAIVYKDALCYVKTKKMTETETELSFVMNGVTTVFKEHSSVPAEEKRRLVSMGAYLLIFPDKFYINTKNLSDRGCMEQENVVTGTVTFTLCTADGGAYGKYEPSPTEPPSKNNMDLWLDISVTPNVLRQYSSASGVWVDVATTYVRIEGANIAKGINGGDGVFLSGCSVGGLDGTVIVEHSFHDKGDDNKDSYRAEGTKDYIVVIGVLQKKTTQPGGVTVKRALPDTDFEIECGNRLWGCKYGFVNGTTVNEIYASKLGDFKNWNCFEGISTDSYVASRGSDGAFTGAINYFGQPLFFKENVMHKVSGAYPANFTVTDLVCRGVEKGSAKSLAIVNEKLLYKAVTGVCIYDGSLPQEISAPLGDKSYKNAVAGAHGNKYYLSMESEAGKEFFLYDVKLGVWTKQDAPDTISFCSAAEDICLLTEDGTVLSLLGNGEQERQVAFWGITGQQGLSASERKFVSRVTVRFLPSLGSTLSIYVEYDGNGSFQHVGTFHGSRLKTMSVPVRIRRCDHFRIKLAGKGDVKVFSIVKTLEEGGLYR